MFVLYFIVFLFVVYLLDVTGGNPLSSSVGGGTFFLALYLLERPVQTHFLFDFDFGLVQNARDTRFSVL